MKLELNFNWTWVLQKVRIVFLLAIAYVLYTYTSPVFAFMWGLYFVLNDLIDIDSSIEEIKEERKRTWKNISTKRKDF